MNDYSELKRLAEAAAEIEDEHEWYAEDGGYGLDPTDLKFIAAAKPSAVLALIAEVEELRKDAERYRWLRKGSIPLNGHDFLSSNEILDRRIDAAMSKGNTE